MYFFTRKGARLKRINLNIPDDLRVKLKKQAVDENTSYTQIIIRLIEQYLEAVECSK